MDGVKPQHIATSPIYGGLAIISHKDKQGGTIISYRTPYGSRSGFILCQMGTKTSPALTAMEINFLSYLALFKPPKILSQGLGKSSAAFVKV